MSDPLQVMAASDGSTSISDMITVNKTASGGVYPMEYILHYRGTYVMNVTGADGQVKGDCGVLKWYHERACMCKAFSKQ